MTCARERTVLNNANAEWLQQVIQLLRTTIIIIASQIFMCSQEHYKASLLFSKTNHVSQNTNEKIQEYGSIYACNALT